jgi:hypothetical protein
LGGRRPAQDLGWHAALTVATVSLYFKCNTMAVTFSCNNPMLLFWAFHRVDAMRLKLRSVVAGFATLGMVALSASGYAANNDPSSSMRGSLGAPLADLSLDNDFGLWAFVINAIFALACIIAAVVMARHAPRQSGSTRGTYSSGPVTQKRRVADLPPARAC